MIKVDEQTITKKREDLSENRELLTPEYKEKLHKIHYRGAFARSGAGLFLWIFVMFGYLAGTVRLATFLGTTSSVLFLILLNPPTLWLLKRTKKRRAYQRVSMGINALEVIGYTSFIYFLGGIETLHLSLSYAALIAYVGIVAPRRLPFIIATFCSLALTLMVLLEYFGYLPSLGTIPGYSIPFIPLMYRVGIVIVLLFVIAYLSSQTASLITKNRDKLRQQNEELNRSRLQLSEAAKALEEKNRELEATAHKAKQSDRMKSEFLANMSHELRTPLNHVIGFTELLLDKHFGDLNDMQNEYLADVLGSSRHLLSLINDILDLSKVEAGKLELEPNYVDIRLLLDKSLTMVKEKAIKHDLKMGSDFDGIPDVISADERKLKQIIYNLLANAVKFTPPGGNIILSAKKAKNGKSLNKILSRSGEEVEEEFIQISVTDSGIGIQKDEGERIFKPFEQGDSSSDKRYEGTGLGLSLCKKFIELHRGHIWFESEGEGKGSTFHVLLPVSQPNEVINM